MKMEVTSSYCKLKLQFTISNAIVNKMCVDVAHWVAWVGNWEINDLILWSWLQREEEKKKKKEVPLIG